MSHHSEDNIHLPPGPLLDKARAVARAAESAGGRALLVGGYVRDALLGHAAKDADLEVYRVAATELPKLLGRFGRVNSVGESYRVYKLSWRDGGVRHELDVSPPRHDKKTGAGHKGFEVTGDPDATFEDAARRRDFTINAIMADPLTGEIVDPFAGRADLNAKLLRVVDANHFADDSLRVLRAMQFAARFELAIEPATMDLCRSIGLADLPAERIWLEFEKLFLAAKHPSLGLRFAHKLRVLAQLFPYLDDAYIAAPAPIGASLNRVAAVDPPSEKRLAVMLAALGAFIPAHLEPFLDALNVFTWEGFPARKIVTALVAERQSPVQLYERSRTEVIADGELRRLAGRAQSGLLFELTRALGNDAAADWFRSEIERLGLEVGAPPPLLMGRHLLEMGWNPGPLIGKIVAEVYELQLDGEITTLEEAQAAAANCTANFGTK